MAIVWFYLAKLKKKKPENKIIFVKNKECFIVLPNTFFTNVTF
jgi:hypothetical protein